MVIYSVESEGIIVYVGRHFNVCFAGSSGQQQHQTTTRRQQRLKWEEEWGKASK